jgi:SpoIID/LytB domain protein
MQYWPGGIVGTALAASCLVGLAAKPSVAQTAPLNPVLDVGVVQRFGSEAQDQITLKPETGDRLTLNFKMGSQEKTITTTNVVKLEVATTPLPEPEVAERVVLSTHRSFESAEDSADQWKAQGIEVEIAQPRQWQVWAKRETYGTPLLRRLLMQNLQAHGSRTAFIDTQVQQSKPQATFTVDGTQYQQNQVEINTAHNRVEVSFNREDHGTRLYAGSLTFQPNAYGTYTLVNHVPLETYLQGVVPHEIGQGAPQPTVEAQAILARTYALRNLRRFAIDNYQICADTQCQVYWGLTDTDADADRAINATRGLVLTYQNELIDALYSSTTGGITAPFSDVWNGPDRPYLKAVVDSVQNVWNLSQQDLASEANFHAFINHKQGFNEDGWDMFRWRVESPLTEIAANLKSYLQSKQNALANFTQIEKLEVTKRSPAGRVQQLTITTDRGIIELEKDEILRAVYAPNSTLFYLEPTYAVPQNKLNGHASVSFSHQDTKPVGSTKLVQASPNLQPTPATRVLKGYVFVGGGLGHGVGMSQTGAYHLGNLGWSSSRILEFYYPGTQLQPLSNAITFWKEPSPNRVAQHSQSPITKTVQLYKASKLFGK